MELIRKYEPALGSISLKLSQLENEYRNKAAKSVVALKDLEKGKIIEIADVALKRTGTIGSEKPIRMLGEALNQELKMDVKKDHPISEEMI